MLQARFRCIGVHEVGLEVDGTGVGDIVTGEALVGPPVGLANVGAEVKYFCRFKSAGLFVRSRH
jgi:hypothetical protein